MKKIKIKIIISLLFALAFNFFVTSSINAQEKFIDKEVDQKNVIEKIGLYFEVFASENNFEKRTVAASNDINARIEFSGRMLTMNIEPNGKKTKITVGELIPGNTYYKYRDSLNDLEEFRANDAGVISFVEDLSDSHLVWIQDWKSTNHIKNDATGGDCSSIGSWNYSSKTCTLTQDVDDTIEIEGDGITLNGNGYMVDGMGYGYGILVSDKDNVTVKNVTVKEFGYGVVFYKGENFALLDSSFSENDFGFLINRSKKGIVKGNYSENNQIGSFFLKSEDNMVEKNNFSSNLRKNFMSYAGSGIVLESSGYNHFADNSSSNNDSTGLKIVRSYKNNFLNSSFDNNRGNGVSLSSYRTASNNFAGSSIEDNEDMDVFVGNWACDNNFEEAILSGGRKLLLIDDTEVVEGGEYSEVIVCGNFYSQVKNITIKGSENLSNNGMMIVNSYHTLVDSVESQNNTYGIYFNESHHNEVRNSSFEFNDKYALRFLRSDGNNIYDNNILNNLGALYFFNSSGNKIFNNNFVDNNQSVYSNGSNNELNKELPIGGNYWSNFDEEEEGCKDQNNDNHCDQSLSFYGYSFNLAEDEYPWVKKDGWDNSGNSSVAFLPGIQASRLYKKHIFDEDRLWELTNRNEDVRDMYLNSDGTSIDESIYTRDIIDEAYFDNVYKKFINFMDSKMADGTIRKWKALPYDWRMPLDNIVNDGIKLEGGNEYYLIEEIRELASNSDTGKVTLIGHSNGGLVGKVLIEKLKETGEENLIDKFIMVATPQLGTPKAIGGVLHGDGLEILGGLLLDKKTARGLAENMSSAYSLLPSEKYFEYVQTPVVEFDDDVSEIYDFQEIYGDDIDNYEELKGFLTGDEGRRDDPDFSDIDSPNVLSNELLSRAEKVHANLDNWQAPEGMEIVQIAGWGLDTMVGVKYDDCDIPFCPDKLSNLDRELVFEEDGDETVVLSSAIGGNKGEKYYLNLKGYNNENFINRKHYNITEVDSLQNFIANIIEGNRDLPQYISTEKPILEEDNKRLRFQMHSPVKVDLYDEKGNHTGIVENTDPNSDLILYEEEIPNSYYMEFGDVKYLGSDGKDSINVDFMGEDLGTFTFEVEEVFGSGEVENTVFVDIPVMKGAKASLEIDEDVNMISLDVEGDGEVDFEIFPCEDQNGAVNLDILGKILANLEIHKITQNRLLKKLRNIKKQIEKDHLKSASAMLESLQHQVEVFSQDKTVKKFRISNDDAQKLIGIIEVISNNLK